ncbi:helix-turn-helix transcriptional regulator [Staphylococcus hyicus]|uniref:helix-turn-helix transcriptional regulator n=1 Tax=Staphylococcus hyicus TaxID=1284 RepID=UPI00273911C1|nr:helix-turn-helix transcriptional regulator [Staphylococcus hyicus]MDP4459844.1 helix-turn-helix transcriptional regulator [Staphylococcus hyicus]MDP4467967.1 helix-turn-helix transcriptional regulator [Staphylococcus hyicus]
MPEQLTIKNWRQIRGMTQQEVADKLGISSKTVIHWEKDTTDLSNVTIYALAKLYDVELDRIKV